MGENNIDNRFLHIVSLGFTKTADALIEPKLVLTWLMTALGAPAYLAAALVPIREGGALLPQPLIARRVKRDLRRKGWWSRGALIQGMAALAIVGFAALAEGALAGWGIVASLAVFSFGRAIASTTYKDALARTVEQGARGSVTGVAGSIAAATGLAFGAAMAFGLFGEVSVPVVIGAIALAGGLYITASAIFTRLEEPAQEDEADDEGSGLFDYIAPLTQDAQFRRFVLARGFLTVTALAPPFIVMTASGAEGNSLTTLGPLVIASGLAAVIAAAPWGWVADRSSKLALALGGALSAVGFVVAAMLIWQNGGTLAAWLAAALLFVVQIGYQGVRAGRSIYLTDMTRDADRLHYTALSNTVIGVVLMLGLLLGVLAHVAGAAPTLALCAGLAGVGAVLAGMLAPVSDGAE